MAKARRTTRDIKEFGSGWEDRNHPKKRFIVVKRSGMCILMVLAMSVVLLLNHTIDEIKLAREQEVKQTKELNFDHISDTLYSLKESAYEQAKEVSTGIESEIKASDMDTIKSDLDNGDFSEDLYDIIRDNIEGKSLNGINNFRNDIIVMTQNGVYEDLSLKRASDISIRDWNYEIENAYNSSLEKAAIDNILSHSDELIITEPTNLSHCHKDHRKIQDATIESLKEIYMEEGLNGLRNYEILVPVYITDTGDIFGQQDIIQGVKQNTHKIIIIQEFNLYDQLQKTTPELYEDLVDSEDTSELDAEYNRIFSLLYLIGIFYAANIVCMIFYFSSKFNATVVEDRRKTETREKDDNIWLNKDNIHKQGECIRRK